MNTTISIDKEVCGQAQKRAKMDRLSVSAVARILLAEYAEGKIQIGARIVEDFEVRKIEVDEEIQNLMDDTIAIWRNK